MEAILKASETTTQLETAMDRTGPIPRRELFSRLMREHHRELLVYARAIVKDHYAAQDIVQESLIAAYRRFSRFDESRDFGKWMRGIVRHKCIDWFRKQKRTPLPDTEMVEIELDAAAWQETRAAGKSPLFEALEDCVAKLPEKLRLAVDSFYLREKSGEETAEALQISPSTARKRLERARSHLYQCLTEKSGSDNPSNILPLNES